MKLRLFAWLFFLATAFFACSGANDSGAVLWTDTPVMAVYAEAFNEAQNRYKIEVLYRSDIALALLHEKQHPALVAGQFLKRTDLKRYFQPIDYLFGELVINQSAFYPELLAQGNIDGRQLLLPVSFNMPLILYRADTFKKSADNFIIQLDEMREASRLFNEQKGRSFTKMGFSPRWYGDLLASTARMLGSEIKDGKPFEWKDEGIDRTLAFVRSWSSNINASAVHEGEFQFKYLYLPEYKSVDIGRVLFAYMDSSRYFVIPEEKRKTFDYRWLAQSNDIPIDEEVIYAAVCRSGRGKQAAETFLKWLFKEETQRNLLEQAKKNRSNESVFGIAGGFSSIKSVNEKVFPLFYPSLIGHIPPESYLKMPFALPKDWLAIKSRIIVPFLMDASGANPPENTRDDLRRRIDIWIKQSGS